MEVVGVPLESFRSSRFRGSITLEWQDFIIGNKFTLRDLVNGLHVGINLKNGA